MHSADPQENVENSGSDLRRGAENSCYKYRFKKDNNKNNTNNVLFYKFS